MNDKLVRSLRDNPVKYAHILGFTLLTPLHNQWIKEMVCGTGDAVILGHRGSYKTTCLSMALALIPLLRPDKTVFFIRKTDDDVIEVMNQAGKIMESPLFQYLSNEIYGCPLVLTTHTAFKIDTNLNTGNRGQVQVQGLGIKGSLTGKHADIIFTDDIVNKRDRVSRAEREETKRAYMELQNIKNRGGRIMNTGTPWHKEDCISTEMEKIANFQRFTIYDTGLIDDKTRDDLKKSMAPSLFAANYELRHISEEDMLFGDAATYDGSSDDIFGGRAHVDAAYGGEDFTAYTILKPHKDGGYIGLGKMWQGHVDRHLRDIVMLHRLYRAGTAYCEKNGDKGYLARDLRNRGIPVVDYYERENKYIKIATHLKREWPNIKWLPETDAAYLAQIRDYTENAEHDDAPDSAASLLRVMAGKGKINMNKHLIGGF